MNLGEPVRTIICEPATIPVPKWQPEREPVEAPKEEPREPVHVEPDKQ